ncbi:MAG: hypothetical protein M1819_003418 [Sarea resinae]|nr:MAG: hypothetical protein M1819_003418 [Sarea resinae]
MTSIPDSKPTLAFFGATGLCANAALAQTIKAGFHATACSDILGTVVRTPSKLIKLLLDRGLEQSVLDGNLTIIQGDVKDEATVKKALTINGRLVDIVISGVGAIPSISWSWNPMNIIGLGDATICETATRTILSAISSIMKESVLVAKPLMLVISTTGISDFTRDVPLALLPLYRPLLAIPHRDKKGMETALADSVKGNHAPIRGFIAVRPTLLTAGAGLGVKKIRTGWEDLEGEGPGPALGYSIAREDVGSWIFEHIVQNHERDHWAGKMVSLTS